ncbi:DNA topoisomerase [Sulfobacillus acidophilus TPY]|uniref:Uncharacterized protein n=1 Tax=Sulfobacillus acidophilus (strain ATCC 700253 / DSM 10332 / NAL) TaxID=679936 RepID=G8TY49_SULAD|nr:DNA topoisomerase [Sulfobacillus acidophilus TPY]AEW03956.1 hypothetical protein Sulac_0389 [Sulfobacillus acidophilus DSM 10332]
MMLTISPAVATMPRPHPLTVMVSGPPGMRLIPHLAAVTGAHWEAVSAGRITPSVVQLNPEGRARVRWVPPASLPPAEYVLSFVPITGAANRLQVSAVPGVAIWVGHAVPPAGRLRVSVPWVAWSPVVSAHVRLMATRPTWWGPTVRVMGPRGGTAVVEGERKFICEGADWSIWAEVAGYRLTPADVATILSGGVTEPRAFVSRAGKSFAARLRLDPEHDDHVQLVFTERPVEYLPDATCPVDGAPIVIRERGYSCSHRNADGSWCPVVVWRDIMGHEVTPDEARQLLAGEPVGPVVGRTKKGEPVRVTLRFDRDSGKVRVAYPDKNRPTAADAF